MSFNKQYPNANWEDKAYFQQNGGVYVYDGEMQMSSSGASMPPPYDNPDARVEEGSSPDEYESKGLVHSFQQTIKGALKKNRSIVNKIVLLALFVGYTVYFAFAVLHSVQVAMALIVLTALGVFCTIYWFIKKHWGRWIWKNIFKPMDTCWDKAWPKFKWILVPACCIGMVIYVCLDVVRELRQLQSISGVIVFIGYLYVFSKYPDRVAWRPVIVGFGLQFILGILVLRWKAGYDAIRWTSDQIMTFINYSLEGASIVFGNPTMLFHPFVFVIMPMLIYIGAVMSILFYLGITQVISAKMGWFMQICLGTTAIESLSVASNIFLNGMDTMLMLRHYLPKLTRSEFHCFLVGNHATVAGFAFATFVMFGAPPQYLISASVMSAPATFAVAKLNFPETEESQTKTQKDIALDSGDETNFIEAGANGATVAGKTVVAVVVNYIGFLGLLGFVNAFLAWLGNNVGFDGLSFHWICSYLFFPLSLLMGVDLGECREVAKLVGVKIFMSEMLAYQELGKSITAGLSDRSASIATYALCGFSSLSTLAIAVGVWNTVCPSKTNEMSNQLVRVITNANISCFLTACIAAFLYDPRIAAPTGGNSELVNKVMEILPDYKSLMALVGM